MESCPQCWHKNQEITMITDEESGEMICPICGFVSRDSEKKTESKFQEKDDFRGTDEETGESKSQHAPKDVGDYGGTGMSGKDASGRPVGGELWARLRQHNNQTLSPFEKILKAHKPKFQELTRRIMTEAYQTSILKSRSLWPLYERCLKEKLQRGRVAELIMIGVICIHRNNEQRYGGGKNWRGEGTFWEHVTRVTDRKKQEVLSAMNVIIRTLDWETELYLFPEKGKEKSHTELYTIITKMQENNNTLLLRKIWKRATEILGKAIDNGLTAGVSPKNQAGAAIFLAGSTEDPPIPLDFVAAYCDSKKKNIISHIKKFNTILCSKCKSSKSLEGCPHIDNL